MVTRTRITVGTRVHFNLKLEFPEESTAPFAPGDWYRVWDRWTVHREGSEL
jgi:hypothetical protein